MYALVWILGAAIAASGAPVVSVDAQGSLHATALVAMPAAELQARMSDPSWMLQFDPSGTEVRRRQTDGACRVVDYHTPSPSSVDFTVRECQTANGYQATLVRSSLFTRYESLWTFVPEDGRVRVDYVLDVGMPASFPRGLARDKMASSVRSMLERLMGWADARR